MLYQSFYYTFGINPAGNRCYGFCKGFFLFILKEPGRKAGHYSGLALGRLLLAYSDDTDPSSGHVDPPLGKKVKELDGLTILPFFS